MNRYLFVYGLILLLLLAIIACGDGEAPSPTTPPTPATQPEATPTLEPSPTVAPTATPEPTATSQATVSPTTATIQPTVAAPATATPTSPPPPTNTPEPTAAATATPPPPPTNTPESTAAATATPPPPPTNTPGPTATATATPPATPTNTPEPPVASTITIGPSKDNTLYESAGGLLSNGAGQHIFSGKTNRSGLDRRGVIAFDIVGNLPNGAIITSVDLTLNLSKTTAAGETVQLRRLLADWGEGASDASANEGGGTGAASGDATWIHTRFDSETWQTPGGDFSTAASASTTVVGAGKYAWDSTNTMVTDVQGWLDDPSTNFGWLLLGNEDESQTAKRFDHRVHVPLNRPLGLVTGGSHTAATST